MEVMQTPGVIVMLFTSRCTIGRSSRTVAVFPRICADLVGYSIGRWDGDALVAETIGLNRGDVAGQSGHPHSDALRVTERFRRTLLALMEVDVTIDDPKAYTNPGP